MGLWSSVAMMSLGRIDARTRARVIAENDNNDAHRAFWPASASFPASSCAEQLVIGQIYGVHRGFGSAAVRV
jgi:hypothetical protein